MRYAVVVNQTYYPSVSFCETREEAEKEADEEARWRNESGGNVVAKIYVVEILSTRVALVSQ